MPLPVPGQNLTTLPESNLRSHFPAGEMDRHGPWPSVLGDSASADWDLLPVVLWKISPDGTVLKANRASRDFLGYGEEEFVGRPVDDFFVDSIDFRELARSVVQPSGAGGGLEACVRCRDGSTRHVVIDALPLDFNGEGAGVCCAVRDQSVPIRTEGHVREQASFLDRRDEVIIILGLGGEVAFWSRGAQTLYGIPPERAVGRPFPEELVADPAQLSRALRSALEKGEWEGELHQRNSSGAELLVESRWILLRGAGGRPESILVLCEDAEEARLLGEERLRAQRQECIGTLAGGIAHDLNNILQPISIALDLFRVRLPDRDSQELFEAVDSNLRRATELVRQILTFTSGVRAERSLAEAPALLGEVSNFVRQAFPKTIRFEAVSGASVSPFACDPTQIEQVLLNLCVNARDAMPDGGRLRIEASDFEVDGNYAQRHPQAKPGNYVRISVSDTGMGIPRRLRKKIFEPFFTTKGPEKGTGLGLATVIGIIRSHGGFLTLETEEGCGSSFHVFLPAARPGAKPREAAAGPREPVEIGGRGESILLVDDEPTVLKVMSRSLEKSGYKVLTAEDGEKGLAAFRRRRKEIQLVITDMAMPGMDGPALAAAIRKLDPAVKILCTSGLNTPSIPEPLKHLGISGILSKPCSSKAILQAIKDALAAAA